MNKMITPEGVIFADVLKENNSPIQGVVVEMCLDLLDKIDRKKLGERPLPISKSSLMRGINGLKLDDKTIRTIACLYYQTEDFNTLLNLVPEYLKETIENANNKLTHNGVVSYEVARNPELIQLWNLCSGFGCTKTEGEKIFPEIFESLINILMEHKLVTRSVLRADCWIMSGEMLVTREDGLNHYENMFKMVRDQLLNPDNGRFIQFSGQMRKSSYLKLKDKMVEFFMENVRAHALNDKKEESLSDFDEEMVKFNFQSSLSDLLSSSVEVKNEIH